VTQEADCYKITTDTTEVRAEIVVIGTGTIPRLLNITGEADARAATPTRLFYEIANVVPKISDLSLNRVLIVGSGDVAYDYTLQISSYANKVTILQRTAHTSSLSLLQDRVHASPSITVRYPALLQQIEQKDTKIRILVQSNETTEWITGDLLLVAVGRTPNISFLSPRLLDIYKTASPHPKLFFIGDVKNGNFRQVSIAMGDGMKAAMDIVKS
jgi:thioredoxin reductase (NADPH)